MSCHTKAPLTTRAHTLIRLSIISQLCLAISLGCLTLAMPGLVSTAFTDEAMRLNRQVPQPPYVQGTSLQLSSQKSQRSIILCCHHGSLGLSRALFPSTRPWAPWTLKCSEMILSSLPSRSLYEVSLQISRLPLKYMQFKSIVDLLPHCSSIYSIAGLVPYLGCLDRGNMSFACPACWAARVQPCGCALIYGFSSL